MSPPRLADLASAAELVPLQGLSADEVADLVRAIAGGRRRTNGPAGLRTQRRPSLLRPRAVPAARK